jgi:predicted trehalose synthase
MSRWVWETVRGIDSEAVAPKSLVKSINSCKSFEATSDAADVTRWLTVLAAELAERMMEDEADHARRARTLGEERSAAQQCVQLQVGPCCCHRQQ